MYKNHLYVAFCTSYYEFLIVGYNPINDVWNTFDQIKEEYGICPKERLIIETNCLFLA